MILINSPLLYFRKIVVNDQLERLKSNEISLDDFDINYFRWKLARPGYEAMQKIKEQYASTHPEIVVRINQLYRDRNSHQPSSSKEEFIAAVSILAEQAPQPLLDKIYLNEIEHPWQLQHTKKYYLQSIDLNEDSQMDYLLASQRDSYIYLTLYYFEEGEWKNMSMSSAGSMNEQSQKSFINTLKSGELKITRPRWNHLEVEGKKFQVRLER